MANRSTNSLLLSCCLIIGGLREKLTKQPRQKILTEYEIQAKKQVFTRINIMIKIGDLYDN